MLLFKCSLKIIRKLVWYKKVITRKNSLSMFPCAFGWFQINEKREQYRPVATRGSVLYFCMVEASLICWMYNSSLAQFLEQFDLSICRSEKAQPTHKRVEAIVEYLTYQVSVSALEVFSRLPLRGDGGKSVAVAG